VVGLMLSPVQPLLVRLPETLASAARAAQAGPTLWYLTRATAVAAYIALTFSVILGMLRTVGRQASERVSWVVDELHQVMAVLAGVLVAAHLLSILFDSYIPFSFWNLLLPFSEPYTVPQVPTRLGVFAMYGMVLVLFSTWLRRRISYRLWRSIHYVSLVAFALATAHGIFTGSDVDEPWMRAVYGASAAIVAFLILVRLFAGAPATARQPS
jgi:predicted ferric reductase